MSIIVLCDLYLINFVILPSKFNYLLGSQEEIDVLILLYCLFKHEFLLTNLPEHLFLLTNRPTINIYLELGLIKKNYWKSFVPNVTVFSFLMKMSLCHSKKARLFENFYTLEKCVVMGNCQRVE